MPLLPWRTDADGFRFSNSWTFDSTEQSSLASLAASVAPAAVGAVIATAIGPALALAPFLVLDPAFPGLLTLLTVASSGVAGGVVGSANLPGFGMCGGMVYTSLDYWWAKAALPYGGNVNDQPMRGTAGQATLRDTIWMRLLASLTGGGALQETLTWSLILNQLPPLFGGGGSTLCQLTATEWTKVKASIDAGNPCPIGLIYTTRDVWDQHQILVYGYDQLPGNSARLYVYDNNNPHDFGETGFDPTKDFLTFDLSGPNLKATSPGDSHGGTLAGFFCTNYSGAPPPIGLATSFGEFVTWGGPHNFMTAYGAVLPIADTAELGALGGSNTDPRQGSAGIMPPAIKPHPRDNALLRERSSAPVFLYQGGAPFHVPDPTQLMHFGGWSAVRVVPDNTIAAFAGRPINKTLIREFSDSSVFAYNLYGLALSTTSSSSPDVRVVPDGAIQGLLLDNVTLDYSTMAIGGTCHGKVMLKASFPTKDIAIALTCSQPALATIQPASVTITKGTVAADFLVVSTGAAPISGGYTVTISAMVGEATVTAPLIIEPPGIAQFTLSPTSVIAGQSSTGTITLAALCPAGFDINLFSYTSYATVQGVVHVPPNTKTITFPVNTPALNYTFVAFQATIQASYAKISATATLTVNPSVVAGIAKSIALFPSSVASGGSVTATVTLWNAVNVATDVGLTSHDPPPATIYSGPSALINNMPNSIMIPAGQTQGKFTITTKTISSQVTKRTAVIVAIAIHQVSAKLPLT